MPVTLRGSIADRERDLYLSLFGGFWGDIERESLTFFSYLKKNKQTTNLVGCVGSNDEMCTEKTFSLCAFAFFPRFLHGAVTPFFVVLHSLFFRWVQSMEMTLQRIKKKPIAVLIYRSSN